MSINYGDLEGSPFMVARAEREADARLNTTGTFAGFCDCCGGDGGHLRHCEILHAAIEDADNEAEYRRTPDIWDLQDIQEDN